MEKLEAEMDDLRGTNFRVLAMRYGLTCPKTREWGYHRLFFEKEFGAPTKWNLSFMDRPRVWIDNTPVVMYLHSDEPDWYEVLVDDVVHDMKCGFIPVLVHTIETRDCHQTALYFSNGTMYYIDPNGKEFVYPEEIIAMERLAKYLGKKWGGVMLDFNMNKRRILFSGNCVPATLVILLAIAALGPHNGLRFLRSMSPERIALAYVRVYLLRENLFAPIAIPRPVRINCDDGENCVPSTLVILWAIATLGPHKVMRFIRSRSREQIALAILNRWKRTSKNRSIKSQRITKMTGFHKAAFDPGVVQCINT